MEVIYILKKVSFAFDFFGFFFSDKTLHERSNVDSTLKYIYIYLVHIYVCTNIYVPNILGLFLWCLMSLHNVSFILISYSLEREKLTP